MAVKLPLVSIIIPTHNRSSVLEKCLNSFLAQNYPKNKTEIIVVDDGSTDNTAKIAKIYPKINYYYQSNQGPSSARNLGINKCQGQIVLIVNDDTIPQKNLITEHIKFHLKFSKENYAVLGYFTWSPDINITPFMYWLENGGPAFSYSQIKTTKVTWMQAWSCNLSYKKSFLLKYGLFDQDFHQAAWEDIELSYRLNQHQLKIRYNKNAIAYHYHPTTLDSSQKKMITHGIGGSIFKEKVTDSSILPFLYQNKIWNLVNVIDKIVFTPPVVYIFNKLAHFCETRFICHYLYTYLLLHYRVVGRRRYLNQTIC